MCVRICLLAALAAFPAFLHAQSTPDSSTPRKLALVLANQKYAKSPLPGAAEDGRQVAQSLTACGFQVSLSIDADRRTFEGAIDRFVKQLVPGDVTLVYYSGHALQIAGENYLLPVDFEANDLADAKYTSYPVGRVVEKIEGAGVAASVVVLDASAKNSFGLSEKGRTGLAPMNLGQRTYLATSVAPGVNTVALADSKVSLFAGFFADALMVPGLKLDEIFGQLRKKVYEATSGSQVPVAIAAGDGGLILHPPTAKAITTPSPTFESQYRAWISVKDRSEQSALQEFLSQFPRGSFTDAASLRLQSLSSSAPSPNTAPSRVVANPSVPPETKPRIDPKMARLPSHEVDPNFDFNDADWEFLSQCQAFDRRLEREGMILNDAELQAYVDRVGQSILPSATPPPNVAWKFLVLRDPIPNAFALANGSVYVNSGLLAVLDNESQLASVLAHEITHVTGRHGYRANRSYRKKALTVSIVQMVGNYAPMNSGWGASLQMAAIAAPVIMQASVLGYERELERQADLFALQKLQQTGYDPREMAAAFAHLDERPEVELQTIYYNDHPKLQDRIEYVKQYLTAHRVDDSALFPAHAVQYRTRVARALRVDIQLAMMAARRRTAHVIAQKLVSWDAGSPDNVLALADTYRSLGPWSPRPTAEELSSKGKKDALKDKRKLTPVEEAEKYRNSPAGQGMLRENTAHAVELYSKVLAAAPSRVDVYKSLGMAYEAAGNVEDARQSYEMYIATTADPADAARTQERVKGLSGLSQRNIKR